MKIQEPIVIYSDMSDSLSEISTISKVQISVNGKTSGVYRDSFALDQLYEQNLDYVVSADENEMVSTVSTNRRDTLVEGLKKKYLISNILRRNTLEKYLGGVISKL